MSRRGSIARFVGGMPGPALGAARMLGAASADLAGVVDPRRLTGRGPADDPFDLRDPEYIRR
ncbi:MAG: hypothetical protein WCP28_21485, partial [Actinomycetes bacterium]